MKEKKKRKRKKSTFFPRFWGKRFAMAFWWIMPDIIRTCLNPRSQPGGSTLQRSCLWRRQESLAVSAFQPSCLLSLVSCHHFLHRVSEVTVPLVSHHQRLWVSSTKFFHQAAARKKKKTLLINCAVIGFRLCVWVCVSEHPSLCPGWLVSLQHRQSNEQENRKRGSTALGFFRVYVHSSGRCGLECPCAWTTKIHAIIFFLVDERQNTRGSYFTMR